jgi:glyoxylase-like metal-dependent hydrolase (beta-lactamase superfamily II)/rhodanese-related sulfurtransferase
VTDTDWHEDVFVHRVDTDDVAFMFAHNFADEYRESTLQWEVPDADTTREVGDGGPRVADDGVTFLLDPCEYVWLRGDRRDPAWTVSCSATAPGLTRALILPAPLRGRMTDTAGDVPSQSPATLQARIDRGDPVRVLDLRDRDEVDRWRIAGPSVAHTHRPNAKFLQAAVTDSLEEFVDGLAGEGPITAVCARGEASAVVAERLVGAGYDAHNLAGGMDAWARLSQVTELAGAPTVVQVRRPASGCLGYVVVDGDEAAVVDPLRAFVDRYRAVADERGATVEYAVDTHVHADHVSGLRDLAADATPVMPAEATARGVTFDVTTVTDGDELAVGDAALTGVHAPGHTTGMTAFAVGDVLLSGDSLFVGSVARPDLERGAEGARDLARELYRTITERFARFPDGTTVAPGHHAESPRLAGDGSHTATLGDLRDLRVFAMTEAEFVDHVTGDMPPRPANYETIIAANLGRETVDDDAAFELELGPNNCAATPADD